MRTILLITLAAICISYVIMTPAGVAAAIDSELVKNIKNYIVPVILKDINAVKTGRIDFDKGHVDNVEINLQNNNQDSVQILFNPSLNGISFKMQDI